MLGKEFHNVRISGIACAVPERKVLTDSFKGKFGETVVERFKQTVGIESRYLANEKQTASDLCYVAAEHLMKSKGLSGNDIDALIFITQTPDYTRPSTAFVLHKRLGIRQDCMVFDINLGCSAFVNGVYLLAGLIESGTIKRALMLIGDAGAIYEPVNDEKSFHMMFGDAGSATLLEQGTDTIYGMIRSDGAGYKSIITPVPGFRFIGCSPNDYPSLRKKMDGDEVFLFTITKVPQLFKEFYQYFDVSSDDYDYFILHQANLMILNQIRKKMKLPEEKVPISLTKYGNTDGVSVPVGIVDLCERLENSQNLRLFTSAFGVGLSWGIIAFQINSEDILPMIYTDDYYTEGICV